MCGPELIARTRFVIDLYQYYVCVVNASVINMRYDELHIFSIVVVCFAPLSLVYNK